MSPRPRTSAEALPNDIGPAIRFVPRAGIPADAAPAERRPDGDRAAGGRPGRRRADGAEPAPATLDQAPIGAFDVTPAPGTPVPPEPIPNVQ